MIRKPKTNKNADDLRTLVLGVVIAMLILVISSWGDDRQSSLNTTTLDEVPR